uniref:Phosphoprotein 38 n=1 Tax=Gallid alphaherpesvirus 2 TaxID=10390 RepID=C0KLZ5_9ALPH|nr:phosphoprotein 38 [Gallid alphaherpesvirus 2]
MGVGAPATRVERGGGPRRGRRRGRAWENRSGMRRGRREMRGRRDERFGSGPEGPVEIQFSAPSLWSHGEGGYSNKGWEGDRMPGANRRGRVAVTVGGATAAPEVRETSRKSVCETNRKGLYGERRGRWYEADGGACPAVRRRNICGLACRSRASCCTFRSRINAGRKTKPKYIGGAFEKTGSCTTTPYYSIRGVRECNNAFLYAGYIDLFCKIIITRIVHVIFRWYVSRNGRRKNTIMGYCMFVNGFLCRHCRWGSGFWGGGIWRNKSEFK